MKQGWGPLCKFLGVPVPDVPFPRMNSGGSLEYHVERIKRRSWLVLYEMITVPLCVGFVVCKKLDVDVVGSVVGSIKRVFSY